MTSEEQLQVDDEMLNFLLEFGFKQEAIEEILNLKDQQGVKIIEVQDILKDILKKVADSGELKPDDKKWEKIFHIEDVGDNIKEIFENDEKITIDEFIKRLTDGIEPVKIDSHGRMYDKDGNFLGVDGDMVHLDNSMIDNDGTIRDQNGNVIGKIDPNDLINMQNGDINDDDILDSVFGQYIDTVKHTDKDNGDIDEDILDKALNELTQKK